MTKSFYKIEQGKAQVGSGIFVPEDFTEYEAGNEPEELLLALEVDIEIERIQAIKSKAAELIRNKYPDYKQLNIIRVGGSELEAMSAYIDSIREISNKAEQDGTKVEDVQWQ